MKRLFLYAAASLLALTTSLFAQGTGMMAAPTTPVISMPAPNLDGCNSCPSCYDQCGASCGPRFYASGEYLLWWLRDNKVHVPLVAGIPNPTNLGNVAEASLANPNARILYGPQEIDTGAFSGGRLTLGMALGDEGRLGLELSGLYLPQQSESTTFRSNGTTGLILPYFQPAQSFFGFQINPNQEAGGVVAGPVTNFLGATSVLSGAVNIDSKTQLWGLEANSVYNLRSGNGLRVDGLLGFRYLGLNDDLTIGVLRSDSASTIDSFKASNNFYAGQIGARVSWIGERFTVSANAKLAMGVNNESINLRGSSSQTLDFGGFGTFTTKSGNQGFYTQPTNVGRSADARFAVLPEIGMNVGYRLTDMVTLQAGYTFLYLSDVVRSGDQLNRTMGVTPGTPLLSPGTASKDPVRVDRYTDFWAHGINLGVQLSF